MRLIDADKLKKRLHEYCIDNDPECQKYYDFLGIDDCIDNAPTVEIPNYGGQVVPDTLQGWRYEERPQGEWVEKLDYNRDTYYDCSVCGNSWTTIEGTPWDNGMNFCPNCGASMLKNTVNKFYEK